MSKRFFVNSADVPAALAEEVAEHAHRRGCGTYDGRKTYSTPFKGRHREADVVEASISVADLCNVLQVTPEALLNLREEAAHE